MGTLLQGCRLFKRCPKLPAWHYVAGVQAVKSVWEPSAWHCVAGVQAVKTVSKPTIWALCCMLFKRFGNQPAEHCVAGVHAV